MSETQQGAGWWQASDGKWYAPELHPNYVAPTTPSPTEEMSAGAGSGATEGPVGETPGAPTSPGAIAPGEPAGPGGYAGAPVGYPAGPGGYAGAPVRYPAGPGGYVGPPTAPPAGPPAGGYAYAPGGFQPNLATAKYSGLAIASLVLSIVWLGGIGAILAVIFAIMALNRVSASHGMLRGRGLSIAGLIIGIVGIVGAALTWSLVAWIGTNAHHVTVPVGRTVNVSDSFSLGVSTMQIQSVHRVNQVSGSTSSSYVVANLRVCAGNSGSKTGVFDQAFSLNTGDGNSVSGSNSAQQSSDIGSQSIPSNSCITGTVTFAVGSGTNPTSIDYHGFLPSTYTWDIPNGF
ncbi:MAG: DUF4190 domain-containing protein [Acidimicrobiales bacterium]